MAWSTLRKWSNKALQYAGFYDQNDEPKVNVEGAVQIINANGELVSDFGGGGASNFLVGKSSEGTSEDFSVAYASAVTLTLGNYPSGITGLSATDIELVRHIDDVTGAVIAEYTRAMTPMSIAGNVLTVDDAAFTASDYFVIHTNIPRPSTTGSGGVGGGTSIYSNMQGDFIATPTIGAKTITITALPFTLEAKHIVHGQVKKTTSTGVVSNLNLEAVTVSSGVITLANIADFVTEDTVACIFIGPDKGYDKSMDTQKVIVQNPSSAHTTDVETIINEDDPCGTNLTADAGGGATTIVDATGAFTIASTAVGYIAYNITEATSAVVVSVDSTTQITTGAGATDWSSDEYQLPLVKRYEINADTFNLLTLHWRLTTVANQAAYLKIYATLDSTATADADTNWVDKTDEIFGSSAGVTSSDAGTVEGIKVIDTPTTMLKYMLKLVVEKSTTGVPVGSLFTVFVKKSS